MRGARFLDQPEGVVAQCSGGFGLSGDELACPAHVHPPRQLLQRRRARGRDLRLPAAAQRKAETFVWSKTAEDILTRERRALDALDQIRGNR